MRYAVIWHRNRRLASVTLDKLNELVRTATGVRFTLVQKDRTGTEHYEVN